MVRSWAEWGSDVHVTNPAAAKAAILAAYVEARTGILRPALPDLRTAGSRAAVSPTRGYTDVRVKLHPEQWAQIAAGAHLNGLRATARRYAVSHEAIRQVIRRVAEAEQPAA